MLPIKLKVTFLLPSKKILFYLTFHLNHSLFIIDFKFLYLCKIINMLPFMFLYFKSQIIYYFYVYIFYLL